MYFIPNIILSNMHNMYFIFNKEHKMKKFTLEPNFEFKCKLCNYSDVDTHTNSESEKTYTFVFNGPYKHSEKELVFSQSHGLLDKNTGEEIVSKLLSLYNTFHLDLDEQKYADSLLHFFKKYGPFFDECGSRIPLTVIDNYLALISHLYNSLSIICAPRPLSREQCESLIKDIVFYSFYDCVGFLDSGHHIQEMPFHRLQRESFYGYENPSENPLTDLMYSEIRKTQTNIYKDDGYQIQYFYQAHNVIIYLFDLIKSYGIFEVKKELSFLSDDIYKVLSFLNDCLTKNKIEILTNKDSTLTTIRKINYDFTNEYRTLLEISEILVNHFLKETSSRCAPTMHSSEEKGSVVTKLHFEVSSLYDAILESFLLSDFCNYEYRTCELPHCSNKFWIDKKLSKKKFCCRAHARTAATQRFREEK